MVPRDPPRLSAACRSGRSTAGIGLASADAAAAGSERPTACARSQGTAERRAIHPRPAGGGQGTPRASRLRGAGPRLKREGRLGLGAGPDLRGGVASLERGAKGGNHLTGYVPLKPQEQAGPRLSY